MNVKQKILGTAVLAALLPIIAVVVVSLIQRGSASDDTLEELDNIKEQNVRQVTEAVYSMIEAIK